MPKKTIRCNFFNVNEPENLHGKVNELFNNQYEIVQSKQVQNIDVSGVVARFTFLEKLSHNNNPYWLGIIEKLDVTEQGEASNLEGIRQVYATNPDEGPTVNTGFAYFPLTNTVTLHQKRGGITEKMLGVFLRRLLKQSGVVDSGWTKFTLDLVPDIKKLARLKKAPKVKELIYSYAIPENIGSIKSESRWIFGDHLLASRLKGERIYVKISADSMDRTQTLRKIKDVMKNNPSSLKATTEHNDIEEPLDLLTDKFTDYVEFDLKRGKKETVTLIMDKVNEIFLRQVKLIKNMYVNNEEGEN